MKHVGVGIGLCRRAAVGSAPVGGAGAKVSIGDTRRQSVVCRGVVFDLTGINERFATKNVLLQTGRRAIETPTRIPMMQLLKRPTGARRIAIQHPHHDPRIVSRIERRPLLSFKRLFVQIQGFGGIVVVVRSIGTIGLNGTQIHGGSVLPVGCHGVAKGAGVGVCGSLPSELVVEPYGIVFFSYLLFPCRQFFSFVLFFLYVLCIHDFLFFFFFFRFLSLVHRHGHSKRNPGSIFRHRRPG
mmetsp:Transcript_29334/g.56716  ORF Transcript_29334/g.56716 Transcript_29334/m.56716 type:complete len:241 (+) Transcript_29334:448-1170(+)